MSGFPWQAFWKLRAPAMVGCGNGDRSQQADEWAGPAPATGRNLKPAAQALPVGNISPGVYNPAQEGVGDEKLYHALNSITLLTNTLLLINSGKYHSYFILLTLSGRHTQTPQ